MLLNIALAIAVLVVPLACAYAIVEMLARGRSRDHS
jgi:predicted outer membrane lipoprotein